MKSATGPTHTDPSESSFASDDGRRQPPVGTAFTWQSGLVAGISRTLDGLASLAMPPVCLACNASLGSRDCICPECWSRIDFIGPPLCDRLGLPMPFSTGGPMVSAAAIATPPTYRKARAIARYDGVMRTLIHGFKYRDRHDSRQLFGRWLETAGTELTRDCDVIVPVPLHRWRLLSRRFNQAAILSRELSRRTGRPMQPHLLKRTRRTSRQIRLTNAQRSANVRGAFAVAKRHHAAIAGRNILLVDDVITTGATANACARALLQAGASRVDVLALAMVTDRAPVAT